LDEGVLRGPPLEADKDEDYSTDRVDSVVVEVARLVGLEIIIKY